MKTRDHSFSESDAKQRNRAFTLIELIGVLAILAILASIVAPNVLRSIERAAVQADTESIRGIGEQLKLFLRDQGTLPTSANWTTQLAVYSEMSPTDLATNKRQMTRQMIFDPATVPAERALVLSSMRTGLAVPTSGNINNAARFDQVWQTADGDIPPTSSWNGWNAWNAVANSADYLVVQRVNLLPVYRNELQSFTVSMNNVSAAGGGGGAVSSYSIDFANGTSQSAINIPVGSTVSLTTLRPRDIVHLYDAPGGGSLAYSYVVSTSGKTFDFDGSDWLPK
jgi:prepilin-type N-terminal cleavage/methylation domain-containing protein